jgi:hypothetical protein
VNRSKMLTDDWHAMAQAHFLGKLVTCETEKNRLPVRQESFIKDMRTAYESRWDAADLGIPLWQPTAKQLNFLNDIYETVRW